MAYSIYEQYQVANDVELDEDAIQTDAIPALVNWLFRGYKQIIDPEKQDIWDEFLREFMKRYLNREAYSKKNRVFRSSIMYPMMEYKTYLENADGLWDEINGALGSLTIKHNKKENEDISKARTINSELQNVTNSTNGREESGSSKKDTTDTNALTGKKTDTLGTSQKTTYDSKNTAKETGTDNTKEDRTDTSSTTGNGRVVNSDYPQSVVNSTTVGNPEVQTWTYASNASDSNNKGTANTTISDTTNKTTGLDRTDSKSGSDTLTNTGTVTTDTTSNENRNIDEDASYTAKRDDTLKATSSNTGTTADNYTKDTDKVTESTTEQQVLTDIGLITKKIEFWNKHKLRCIDFVIREYEKYFISEYVSEDRDGYLDWIGYSNLLKYINAEV